MSIPEQVPYKEYRATGSSNTFEITFYLPDPKDLVVMVNKEIPPVGAYSIQGDTVVFGTPPKEGDLVELTRDTQLDRETNFKSYDNSFRPETINFDLDKIWLVLQESNLVDAKILARLKQEIEWRRTHDFNYDELAQVREKQLFDALKGYTDTLFGATNPNIFAGVIAGVVFASDGETVQTHIDEMRSLLSDKITLETSKEIAQKKLIPDLMLPGFGNSKKLIVRRSQYLIDGVSYGSRYYVIISKANNPDNNLLIELRRGLTTTTGSVGGAAELLRVTSVFDGGLAWVGRHGKLAVSAEVDWSEVEYTPAGYTEKLFHSVTSNVDCWKYYASSNPVTFDQFITFNTYFNSRGRANIQFYCTAASCEQVEVYIDDVLRETISLKSATAAIYRHELKAVQGYHQVKIVRKATGVINVFGVNYSNVSESDNNEPYDGLVFWHKNELYTSSEGANEYAIVENSTGLLGGSLHGGEKLKKQTFIIDGVVGDPLGAIRVASNIEIRQETEISWSESAKLGVISSHFFNQNGGYQVDTTFVGKVKSDTFYTAMHTAPNSFSIVVAPNFLDLSLEVDGFKTLNRSNTVVQENPATNKRVYTQTTIFNEENNIYGAPTVRKVTGSYNKLYYGAAISGAEAIHLGDFSVSTKKVFT